jgi:hypothetical protein
MKDIFTDIHNLISDILVDILINNPTPSPPHHCSQYYPQPHTTRSYTIYIYIYIYIYTHTRAGAHTHTSTP